jgi:hypothetical protein
MKASELRNIIKEEIKKVLREAPMLSDDETYYDKDGWDADRLEDYYGLMSWLEDVERLQYEINSARRGSYGIEGDTMRDLVNTLIELKERLEDMIDDME